MGKAAGSQEEGKQHPDRAVVGRAGGLEPGDHVGRFLGSLASLGLETTGGAGRTVMVECGGCRADGWERTGRDWRDRCVRDAVLLLKAGQLQGPEMGLGLAPRRVTQSAQMCDFLQIPTPCPQLKEGWRLHWQRGGQEPWVEGTVPETPVFNDLTSFDLKFMSDSF